MRKGRLGCPASCSPKRVLAEQKDRKTTLPRSFSSPCISPSQYLLAGCESAYIKYVNAMWLHSMPNCLLDSCPERVINTST